MNPCGPYVSVNSADESASKVTAHGGAVITAPFDVFDADRMAVCADPDGALFSLWQPGRHIGAQLVNEPSTWNWSNLNTRDPAGATALYRAVFGWEVASVDFGVGESWMWRRPGYADFLEQLDPASKQRHREAGAPRASPMPSAGSSPSPTARRHAGTSPFRSTIRMRLSIVPAPWAPASSPRHSTFRIPHGRTARPTGRHVYGQPLHTEPGEASGRRALVPLESAQSIEQS